MARLAALLLAPWRAANTPKPRTIHALMACGLVRNMVTQAQKIESL